jgi:diguanylate cyclase (GGDEF)-like protein
VRILVVADDPASQHVVRAVLENLGHTSDLCGDAAAAWARFEQEPYDVVITDRDMPGEAGLDLVRRIRTHSDGRYTYVILITALDSLEYAVEGMESGADDYLLKPLDPALMRLRLIAAARVAALHEQIELMTQRLRQAAITDPLTGLGNRLALVVDLAQLHARVVRYGHTYCLALIDVDHFKSYNDTFGHQAGDAALQAIARAVRSTARAGDETYRYGGEELVVVLPEQDVTGALIALNRMRRAVEELDLSNPQSPHGRVTISIGLALLQRGDGQEPNQALAAADAALYRAKALGRNRIEVSTAPVTVES